MSFKDRLSRLRMSRFRTAGRWAAIVVIAVVVLLVAAAFLIDEPLRRYMERELNNRLDGYSVTLQKLDFHPIGLSLDLEGLTVTQNANPDPPVAEIPRLSASVQWSEIIVGRVVANFEMVRPKIHVNRSHFLKELEDPVPIEKRGWQDALQAIYPLKINHFEIVEADITYIDEANLPPLHLSKLNAVAGNIRNIRSKDREYPSTIRAEALAFETGRVQIDGNADFLAEPHLGVKAAAKLENITLERFAPILRHYNFTIRKGTLSAHGDIEYAPTIKVVELAEATIDGIEGDYVHRPRTAAAERTKETVKEGARKVQEVSNDPGTRLKIAQLKLVNGNLGFVNPTQKPQYRVFLSNAALTMKNVSNQRSEGLGDVALTGKFMGSGDTTATAHFRAESKGPDFDLAVRIENTDMRAMNDLLRAHGKFDVTAGVFSFYTEIAVKNRQIRGYMKPLFRDLVVYDPAQDRDEPAMKKLYERVVGGVAKILKNQPRDEVATVVDISGPLENPQSNTGEVILRLIQNAFIKAILPGFDRESRRGR